MAHPRQIHAPASSLRSGQGLRRQERQSANQSTEWGDSNLSVPLAGHTRFPGEHLLGHSVTTPWSGSRGQS